MWVALCGLVLGCTRHNAPAPPSAPETSTEVGFETSLGDLPDGGDESAVGPPPTDADSPSDGALGDAERADAPKDGHAFDGDHTDSDEAGPESWRSALFPEDWTPETTAPSGAFLHDFSYAGYRNGAVPVPALEALGKEWFDVVDFGAQPDSDADCTAAVQAAIDAASEGAGGIVWFPAGIYRVDGLLTVTTSGVVLSGEGAGATQLHFTRDVGMSDTANLTFKGSLATAHELPLAVDADSRQRDVWVSDASVLTPGDAVDIGWTITEAFVADHQMTATWGPHNGTWQTFFRRQVVAIDTESSPHRVTLDVPLRYPALMRDGATLRKVTGYLTEVGLLDLSVGNAVDWDAAWTHDRAHAVMFDSVADGYMMRVTSVRPQSAPDSGLGSEGHLQSGGLVILRSKRFTVANVVMEQAQNRGGGGNGYLFELRASNEVLIRDSQARVGRHNFIQNWEFGTTGCVILRCLSEAGEALLIPTIPQGIVGYSEFHHSLAMANLIDDSVFHDGWKAENRGSYSSGAGLTSTENVLWRPRGDGIVVSRQFGLGYVIGADMDVITNLAGGGAVASEPEDYVEGTGKGAELVPTSLYEAQLSRRLGEP